MKVALDLSQYNFCLLFIQMHFGPRLASLSISLGRRYTPKFNTNNFTIIALFTIFKMFSDILRIPYSVTKIEKKIKKFILGI